ncbi:Holliday junction branch migration protein RuvA [Candidatus Peregrinibacteria bacterium]|nr:Holliday junction branch migration protein RuvA [Candidatus Peregrinibacteria bacterium]
MIAHLRGKILKKTERGIILETNSIGYFVHLAAPILEELKDEQDATFFIHTNVREDTLDLYGFKTFEELAFFKQLINISGIGPKTALEILAVSESKIKEAIMNEDMEFIRKIHGIGPKTAKRIILELKGTIAKESHEHKGLGMENDVIEALLKLGYPRAEILRALKTVPQEMKEPEEIIRYFLKNT